MQHDDATLLDVARAATRVIDFTTAMDHKTFIQDTKTQSAVLHQLLVMGEAVKRLSVEVRSAHPAVPWALIAGMRDKLIHAYDEVDLEEVWKTIEKDIPELLKAIDPLLSDDAV